MMFAVGAMSAEYKSELDILVTILNFEKYAVEKTSAGLMSIKNGNTTILKTMKFIVQSSIKAASAHVAAVEAAGLHAGKVHRLYEMLKALSVEPAEVMQCLDTWIGSAQTAFSMSKLKLPGPLAEVLHVFCCVHVLMCRVCDKRGT